MGLRIRAWNALPEAGGLLDQEAGKLDLMAELLGVYNTFRDYNETKGGLSNWITRNPQGWKTVCKIRDMRVLHEIAPVARRLNPTLSSADALFVGMTETIKVHLHHGANA